MNLRQIEVFHAVYTAGSISAAARLLNVSQPSISKIVKHTEARLGFPLFLLVKGRLAATDEAHILFREVDELYQRIGTFQQTAYNLRSRVEGTIRIGLLPSLALSVGPEAVARFGMVAPRANFEIRTVFHDNFRQTLAARDCDLVIGHHLLQGPEAGRIPLGTGAVGVIFRESMLPATAGTIHRDMLSGHEIIGLASSVAISRLVDEAIAARAGDRQRRIVVNTVYVAAALARQGVGIAIVDEFTARGLTSPGLCFRPIEPAIRFELDAVHLVEHPPSRLARSFIDVLRHVIARTGKPEGKEDCPQAILP